MIVNAFRVNIDTKHPLQFVTGLNSIPALACSVAAQLVIRPKRSYGYVRGSIPALSSNSPAQSSEILMQHPG
jgi:hypothetical protein